MNYRQKFIPLNLNMENKPTTTSNNIMNFSPETLISQAIDKNLPVETMEKLLMMRKELRAEFAKEEFDAAMSKFQAECPTIEKTKDGPIIGGKAAYKYAPIEAIVEQVKNPLEKNGFSYSIQTNMAADRVKVTCVVKHKLGHSETSDMEVPLGDKNKLMSAPQHTAAAMTYAKRYAFCNAFGIMTGDEDTDAQPVIVQSSPQNIVKTTTAPVAKSSPPSTSPKCPGFDGSGKCGAPLTGTYQLCYNCNLKKKYGSPAPKEDTGELTPEEFEAYEKQYRRAT